MQTHERIVDYIYVYFSRFTILYYTLFKEIIIRIYIIHHLYYTLLK